VPAAGRGGAPAARSSAAPAAASAAGVGSNVRGAVALRRVAVARAAAGLREAGDDFAAAVFAPADDFAAAVFAPADGFAAAVFAPADGFVAVDVFVAGDLAADGSAAAGFLASRAAACAACGCSNVFGALARRPPIRSGRVEGSAARTPFSSFLGFGFDFFGFSTLSAMRLRVYGSRSGRGARPPS
jgi:hypothetical protein